MKIRKVQLRSQKVGGGRKRKGLKGEVIGLGIGEGRKEERSTARQPIRASIVVIIKRCFYAFIDFKLLPECR